MVVRGGEHGLAMGQGAVGLANQHTMGNTTAYNGKNLIITPGTEKASHHGFWNAMEPLMVVQGAEQCSRWLRSRELLANLHSVGKALVCCPKPVQCSRYRPVLLDAAMGKDPAGLMFSTHSPQWVKL